MSTSVCNLVFVYSLLVLDLLINITDNLFSSIQPNSYHRKDIGELAFTIVMIQIVAILCVLIDLILYFYHASDKVCQYYWTQLQKGPLTSMYNSMPQRLALKLVLDKYWWSLLIGAIYLVLTIILQIVRLNPVWHYAHYNYDVGSASVELNDSTSDLATGFKSISLPDKEELKNQSSLDYHIFKQNLIPITVLLVHKLASTCYYVSFFVVYKTSTCQIMHKNLKKASILAEKIES